MRVCCVGGGPAGLYLGILLKASRPDIDVRVYERDGPDDAFGWGIVFSAPTLERLREADPPSYDAITAEVARWETIAIHAHERTVYSSGHAFCGLARDRFLSLLQRRARALGVDLRFHTPATDLDALAREHDVLVGADGLRSVTRDRFSGALEPRVRVGSNRFIWLGTRRRFAHFTFAFRHNGHGLFQVHAYPYDREMSTFIVECDEATWRRAGLDDADEQQSARYCERLFEPELGGERLLCNDSRWMRFETVRNARWHHENVVLLGDAAHTAHFSVGSGTRLALDGAISLARALLAEDDVPAALEAYEVAHRPRVERLQAAALRSQRWFEDADRHVRLPTAQLAFSLMTRTPRVTRDGLRERDPRFVEDVERSLDEPVATFTEPHTEPPTGGAGEPLERPLRLREVTVVGRVATATRTMPMDADAAGDLVLLRDDGGDPARWARRIAAAHAAAKIVGLALVRPCDEPALAARVRAAARAGFDVLELDAVGADVDTPTALQVLREVRACWPEERPLGVHLDGSERALVETGVILARCGVDAVRIPACMPFEEAVHASDRLRNDLGLTTLLSAATWPPDEARTLVLAGRVDAVTVDETAGVPARRARSVAAATRLGAS